MQKDIDEIKLEINDQLKVHLNQLKKWRNEEIRSKTMKLFHFIMKQQIKLIKKTADIEKELELNLNNFINKEINLLSKLEINLTEYNEIKNNNLKINFNYEFKTNEIIEKNLIIGRLVVLIYLILITII